MSALPLFIRAVLAADRVGDAISRASRLARDEVLISLVPPDLRSALTDAAYDRARTYLPGGQAYESGLFEWEKAVLPRLGLADAARPKSVLLGGAGGGRELAALGALGHRVVAFEPASTLYSAANVVANELPRCAVLRASYGDFVRAVSTGHGPLADLGGPFDAVIFGWGSFTHVTEPNEQLALLRAARIIAPHAPVLLSFFIRRNRPTNGSSSRARTALRRALAVLPANRSIPPGLGYQRHIGFVYALTKEELTDLAAQAGYEVAVFNETPYAHAVLEPGHER